MDAIAQYRSLRKDGRLAEAATLARKVIASLAANEVAQLGKMLLKDLPTSAAEMKALDVLLLGQCTTSYLPPLLTAWAWAEGVRVSVREGEYDQVVQHLMNEGRAPNAVILLPWNQRLLAHDRRTAEERIEDEMVFLQQAWAQVARLQSKLVQVSYDWIGAGALGYSMSARRGGDIGLVRQANASLHAALPAGAFFVDLEHVSAWHGKSRFYDERNYHWLKQPFSPEGLGVLARKMATGLRVLTTGRKKVLVLDLDNTLWGGVVGELGPNGIAVGGSTEGEAFLAFQKHVKRLKESGVLLVACSKNNEADAKEPFEKNEAMHLRLEDFAAFHASWDTKPSRLREIAQELNLGLDSFVFFDDNPAEREHVRADLPEVIVPEVPVEPALFIRALQETLAFEAVDLTTADAERAGQYAAEASRKRMQTDAATPEQYLASLEMRAEVQPIDESNLDRVVDLITKTNQFNLTTRRHSRAAVEQLVASPRSVCFAVKLSDRFGDYGLIAVVLGRAEENDDTALRLDTWLMSCRAMGRTVEHFTLNEVVAAARDRGYTALLAEYLPTQKNVPVKSLLPGFGFVKEEPSGANWTMDVAQYEDKATQVAG
jgi:FkbH-like protein